MIINDLVLKEEKIQDHKKNPDECPRCESEKIHAEGVHVPKYDPTELEIDRFPTREFICMTCGLVWEDVYQIIGVRILDMGPLGSRKDIGSAYSLYLYKEED